MNIMPMDRDDILKAAMNLSIDDRALLANSLFDSLADGALDPEWAEEIERRIAAYDRGEVQSLSVEEARRIIRDRRSA